MVVTCLPSASLTGREQERTASPLTCTVQAPHCAMPHPYLVPVSPTCSRSTHSKGVEGSTSTSFVCPLSVKRAIPVSLGCGARADLETQVTAFPIQQSVRRRIPVGTGIILNFGHTRKSRI